jgi:thermitase
LLVGEKQFANGLAKNMEGIMASQRIWQWTARTHWRSLVWTIALVSTTSAGLFLGLGEMAQSDISRFEAILAKSDRVPGEALVKLSATGINTLQSQSLNTLFSAGLGILSLNTLETDSRFLKVKLANDQDLAKFLSDANSNPAIAYAEPNFVYRTSDVRDEDPSLETPEAPPVELIPRSPDFVKTWGLKNTGQKDPSNGGVEGKAGADISATKAWVTTTGSKDIVVAVIDTGVDYNHNQLKDNIYANPGESGDGKETNGLDDDGNGFVDDFRGWSFSGGSNNNPMDDNAHGTHCSGTIGASGAGDSIVGVNWNVSIMPIKFLSASGSGSLTDAVSSIQYATKLKVNVMSNSWGGGGYSQAMFDAIKVARDAGILFVAAAGNDGMDNDKRPTPTYPGSYQLDNVISVALGSYRSSRCKNLQHSARQ